jgi:NADPH-dependent curcumin reductase CurA
MTASEPADWAALSAGLKARQGVACQWRVAAHPQGNVRPTDFAWHEEPVPSPAEGEVLLETMYLGLAPVMRMYMQGTGAAGERKLVVGDVIHGRGVARILESRHADWRAGEIVQGQIGWRTYATSAMTPKEKFSRATTCPTPSPAESWAWPDSRPTLGSSPAESRALETSPLSRALPEGSAPW